LSADLKEIEIHALSDWHIGDGMSDFRLIQQTLEYIKNTPNAFVMLNGDLMDTAICSSIGDTYGANLQPMEQLKTCVKLFEPIKDKILCILPGNHENRVYKTDGIDMTALMAAQLGLSERYTDTTALLFVRFGHNDKGRKMCYTIYTTHGSGGGRKEGGKINRLADLATIVDADCYVCGHAHLPALFKERYYRPDPQNSAVACVDKLFVNTASTLDYGGYGDKQGYKPASKDNPIILLNGKEKKMRAIL
jgi:predicted phosphodiesterase